jgi:hypothetical protein
MRSLSHRAAWVGWGRLPSGLCRATTVPAGPAPVRRPAIRGFGRCPAGWVGPGQNPVRTASGSSGRYPPARPRRSTAARAATTRSNPASRTWWPGRRRNTARSPTVATGTPAAGPPAAAAAPHPAAGDRPAYQRATGGLTCPPAAHRRIDPPTSGPPAGFRLAVRYRCWRHHAGRATAADGGEFVPPFRARLAQGRSVQARLGLLAEATGVDCRLRMSRLPIRWPLLVAGPSGCGLAAGAGGLGGCSLSSGARVAQGMVGLRRRSALCIDAPRARSDVTRNEKNPPIVPTKVGFPAGSPDRVINSRRAHLR